MTSLTMIRNLTIVGLLSSLSVACVYDPVYYGPPHHTVRSGYYAPWDYYYYPDVQVYFQYSTGFYFYYDTGVWVRTRILPPRFHLNPRARVELHIESDRPYLFHHQHVEKYRSMPRYRTTPELDRRERNYQHDRYEQYRRSGSQPRVAPPAVHTRPTPAPREREYEQPQHRPAPRHEREKQGTRFDSPPQHQPIPLVPRQAKPTHDRQQQPERQMGQPRGEVKQKTSKSQKRYDKQYKEQDQQQYEEQAPQDGDKKRSKKDERDKERDKRYR